MAFIRALLTHVAAVDRDQYRGAGREATAANAIGGGIRHQSGVRKSGAVGVASRANGATVTKVVTAPASRPTSTPTALTPKNSLVASAPAGRRARQGAEHARLGRRRRSNAKAAEPTAIQANTIAPITPIQSTGTAIRVKSVPPESPHG